jgi:L-threonylcarbamoyladenylate synthase
MLLDSAAGHMRAAALLRSGHLVAFPTETVYGLGADACDDTAVARVFEAKERPSFNPLIVHVADAAKVSDYAHMPDVGLLLAKQFWPGALTLVLPLRETGGLSPLVTAGLDSVAIRVPSHPSARDLLKAFGGPVAAPSANPSGKISPTRAEHVVDGLLGRVDAILDGGACPVGVESTIIGLTDAPTLLRAGGVPVEEIEACLGIQLQTSQEATITAPGQLASHYAPDAPVRLNAEAAKPGEVFLGFGDRDGDLNLSKTGDLVEAAAQLFHQLRLLNEMGKPIAVAPIPKIGLGLAINDRLNRAAAPR